MANSTICITPVGQTLTQANKFQLTFARVANTIYQCTKVNIPGINVTEAKRSTPLTDLYVPGDKTIFGQLQVTFLLDLAYNSWYDIWNWMTGIGMPESTNQYANLANNSVRQAGTYQTANPYKPAYSDASLVIYTNQNNPELRFDFHDCFPLSLSDVQLAYDTDANFIPTATAVFRYQYYRFTRNL